MALTLNGLAIADMDARKFDDARAGFGEALHVIQAVNGGRHTTALAVLNNTAVLRARAGDFSGAEDAHRRALVLAGELGGENSMAVANGLNNLGTVFANQGKLDAALEQYQLAHAKYAGLVGESHARTANAARNAEVTLLLLDRPAESLSWMERALRGYEVTRGADSRDTTSVRVQHAAVLSALGCHAEAIPRLRAAAARLMELAPPEGHATVADAQMYLGRALFDAGRIAESEAPYRAAIAFRARAAGDPRSRASSECELARTLAATGRSGEARELLDRCIPLIRDYGLVFASRRTEMLKLHERLSR
jgi:tetratricopeptide (TPR) repeat protein